MVIIWKKSAKVEDSPTKDTKINRPSSIIPGPKPLLHISSKINEDLISRSSDNIHDSKFSFTESGNFRSKQDNLDIPQGMKVELQEDSSSSESIYSIDDNIEEWDIVDNSNNNERISRIIEITKINLNDINDDKPTLKTNANSIEISSKNTFETQYMLEDDFITHHKQSKSTNYDQENSNTNTESSNTKIGLHIDDKFTYPISPIDSASSKSPTVVNSLSPQPEHVGSLSGKKNSLVENLMKQLLELQSNYDEKCIQVKTLLSSKNSSNNPTFSSRKKNRLTDLNMASQRLQKNSLDHTKIYEFKDIILEKHPVLQNEDILLLESKINSDYNTFESEYLSLNLSKDFTNNITKMHTYSHDKTPEGEMKTQIHDGNEPKKIKSSLRNSYNPDIRRSKTEKSHGKKIRNSEPLSFISTELNKNDDSYSGLSIHFPSSNKELDSSKIVGIDYRDYTDLLFRFSHVLNCSNILLNRVKEFTINTPEIIDKNSPTPIKALNETKIGLNEYPENLNNQNESLKEINKYLSNQVKELSFELNKNKFEISQIAEYLFEECLYIENLKKLFRKDKLNNEFFKSCQFAKIQDLRNNLSLYKSYKCNKNYDLEEHKNNLDSDSYPETSIKNFDFNLNDISNEARKPIGINPSSTKNLFGIIKNPISKSDLYQKFTIYKGKIKSHDLLKIPAENSDLGELKLYVEFLLNEFSFQNKKIYGSSQCFEDSNQLIEKSNLDINEIEEPVLIKDGVKLIRSNSLPAISQVRNFEDKEYYSVISDVFKTDEYNIHTAKLNASHIKTKSLTASITDCSYKTFSSSQPDISPTLHSKNPLFPKRKTHFRSNSEIVHKIYKKNLAISLQNFVNNPITLPLKDSQIKKVKLSSKITDETKISSIDPLLSAHNISEPLSVETKNIHARDSELDYKSDFQTCRNMPPTIKSEKESESLKPTVGSPSKLNFHNAYVLANLEKSGSESPINFLVNYFSKCQDSNQSLVLPNRAENMSAPEPSNFHKNSYYHIDSSISAQKLISMIPYPPNSIPDSRFGNKSIDSLVNFSGDVISLQSSRSTINLVPIESVCDYQSSESPRINGDSELYLKFNEHDKKMRMRLKTISDYFNYYNDLSRPNFDGNDSSNISKSDSDSKIKMYPLENKEPVESEKLKSVHRDNLKSVRFDDNNILEYESSNLSGPETSNNYPEVHNGNFSKEKNPGVTILKSLVKTKYSSFRVKPKQIDTEVKSIDSDDSNSKNKSKYDLKPSRITNMKSKNAFKSKHETMDRKLTDDFPDNETSNINLNLNHSEIKNSNSLPININSFSPDPNIVSAVAKTMIGSYMFMSEDRKTSMDDILKSPNKNLWYFWIHPYSKILNWSKQSPAEVNASSPTPSFNTINQHGAENTNGHSSNKNLRATNFKKGSLKGIPQKNEHNSALNKSRSFLAEKLSIFSSKAPNIEQKPLSNSIFIDHVRIVADYQTSHYGDFPSYSILVSSKEKLIRIKALNVEDHDLWYMAFSYLQTRKVIASAYSKASLPIPRERCDI
ncbi:hypothetical protein AYI68_g7639 [Smittium mucronatum]|uniref:Pleckstrin homology domain-containing protein n=1 Tax=Smittium mucronatum TaxID=133383 RepID=A0A1R0GN41_9FUNG|nr:hypothetical protein AYI68_g7639 [Smittium mucronatum]